MKEMSEELLQPDTLWETHMGLQDELEVAQHNRVLLSDVFGERSEIAYAAIALEVAIRGLRAELRAQIAADLESGKTMAAIDASEVNRNKELLR